MTWGDEFEKMVPRIVKPKHCNCEAVRTLMNQQTAATAAQRFQSFENLIVHNAKKSILRPIPTSLLESAIRRRMKKAYKQAFGIDLD